MGNQSSKCFKKDSYQSKAVQNKKKTVNKNKGYDIKQIPSPGLNYNQSNQNNRNNINFFQYTDNKIHVTTDSIIKKFKNQNKADFKNNYQNHIQNIKNVNSIQNIHQKQPIQQNARFWEKINANLTNGIKKLFNKNIQSNDLLQIKQILQSLSQNLHLIQKQNFQFIFNQINKYYVKEQDQLNFILIIQNYLDICRQFKQFPQKQDDIKNKTVNFGKQLSKFLDQLYFKHLKVLNIAQHLFNKNYQNQQKINLNQLTYDLQNQNQFQLVAKVVKITCQNDMDAFYFLSDYLQKSVLKFHYQKRKNVQETQQILTNVLKKLGKSYPPNQNLPTTSKINNLQSIKASNYKNKSIDLSKIDPLNRSAALDKFIFKIAEIAKFSLPKLVMITKQACQNNNGISYKTGVKIKTPLKNKSSVDRVKQKLFSKSFLKYKITNESNLQQFLQVQSIYYQKQMSQQFKNLNGVLQFKVSDMVRGKCMFQKISQINQAASQIIKTCQLKNYKIIQIDNRLGAKTTDLVLKIQIDEIIAEFQLAYKFNVVANQFNHKIYELQRSNFFTLISTLFNFNSKADEFFQDFQEILQFNLKNDKQIRVKPFGTTLQTIFNLHAQFQKFMKNNSNRKKRTLQEKFKDSNSASEQYKNKMKNSVKNLQKNCFQYKNPKNQQNLLIYHTALFLNSIKGKYNEAKKKAIECKMKCSKDNDSKTLMYCLYLLRQISSNLGQLQQDLLINQQLLVYEKSVYGQNSLPYFQTNYNIGFLYYKKYLYDQALKYYTKCIEIQKIIGNNKTYQFAKTLKDISLIYSQKEKYDKALQYIEAAQKIIKSLKGNQSDEEARILYNIGDIHFAKGDKREALKYYQKSLHTFEKVYGQYDIMCSYPLNNIGAILSQYEYDENKAIKCYQKALQIKQRAKGQNSVDCCSTLDNIGKVYTSWGKYDQALKFHFQAYQIQVLHKGKDSLAAAFVLNYIAWNYQMKTDYSNALKYYLQIVQIRKKNQKQETLEQATTYFQISSCFSYQRKYQQSVQNLIKSIKIKQRIKGQLEFSLYNEYKSLALVYFYIQKYQIALQCYQKCLLLVKKKYSQQNIYFVNCLISISSCEYQMRRYERALKILKQIQYIVENKGLIIKNEKQALSLQQNLDFQTFYFLGGYTYFYMRNIEKSLIFHKKRIDLMRQKYGKNSIQEVLVYKDISFCCKYENKLDQAIKNLQLGIKICKSKENNKQFKQLQTQLNLQLNQLQYKIK